MYHPLLDDEEGSVSEEEENGDDDEDEDVVLWTMESTKLLGDGKKTYNEETPPIQSVERETLLGYPRSVFFIVGNEFCERFSYYGMKAILTLYLHQQLMYTEDASTVIYHFWAMLCYFTPVLGAILADSYLGRYRTILYISLIYVVGNTVLALGAIPPLFPDLTAKISISLLGLLLIALGTGGIKPCVSAFGGDQFLLPQQQNQLAGFFSMFYFSINAGSLLSTFLTPVLRADVQCFSQDCYPLAFAVPALLMVVALVLFIGGSHLYIKKPAEGSVVLQVVTYCTEALRRRCGKRRRDQDNSSSSSSSPSSSSSFDPDMERLMRLLLLFVPLPFFWALFDQQGSRWTFQATRMDGQIGQWDIKPDQMQVVNPLFILLLIPVFDKCVYPWLEGRGWLKLPLQRMLLGGVLAGVAFIMSAVLELNLESTYPVEVKQGEARVTLINTLPCDVTIEAPGFTHNTSITTLQQKVVNNIDLGGSTSQEFNVSVKLDNEWCGGHIKYSLPTYTLTFTSTQAHLVLVTADSSFVKVVNIEPPDSYHKSDNGQPKLRLVYNLPLPLLEQCVKVTGTLTKTYTFCITDKPQGLISGTPFQTLHPGRYDVHLPTMTDNNTTHNNNTHKPTQVELRSGGVYNLLIQKPLSNITNTSSVVLYEVTPPNSVHMAWLLPQYLTITVSEVMFSITGLQFSFTQAPSSMKSVVQAAWLITVAFGNLIVVIIAGAKIFERQAQEFFLFAGLMFVDMICFAFLAKHYKYNTEEEEFGPSKHNTQQQQQQQHSSSGNNNKETLSSDETTAF
ncbi:hypothetical protein Pmani_015038 [Petrolisthes manimaculis]|uniref:Oligopeptide transporter 1 n=2 Tax=Petrolisthes TaxID=84661 RepID=A0AAE1PUG9_9EUCA|nr:hypothetical protein Pmani_015038 [Petrolisthes manimaculis]